MVGSVVVVVGWILVLPFLLLFVVISIIIIIVVVVSVRNVFGDRPGEKLRILGEQRHRTSPGLSRKRRGGVTRDGDLTGPGHVQGRQEGPNGRFAGPAVTHERGRRARR